MLQAFAFEKVGVVVGDIYFLDPDPHPGQEGPEHGVRVELRAFDRGELKSSIYSAVPISVGHSGTRGYCADENGEVRFDPKGGTNCTELLQ